MPVELRLQRPAYMSDRQVSLEEISDWAEQHNYRVLNDYARFIARYNGGTVEPFVFAQTHPNFQEEGGLMVLEDLFDWDSAIAQSDFDHPQTARHLPPGHLAIGASLGAAAYVTMTIAAGTIGQISVVERRCGGIWGFEGLDRIAHVANSFSAFLALLHEPPTGPLYHGYWNEDDPDAAAAMRIRI